MFTSQPMPIPSRLGLILFKTPDEAGAVLENPCFKDERERISIRSKVPWTVVAAPAGDALYSALDIEIAGVLGNGWSTLEGLQVYWDRERHPPPEPVRVPLARHTIASVHSPGVEILLDETVFDRITLNLELALVLDAIVLVIRDGRIVAIESGRCTVTCSLKFGDVVLLPIETPVFEFPGAIELGEGIPLPGLGKAA